jgi:hypothetical protein
MPPLRGEVYFPKNTFPPGSADAHRIIVLSSNNVLSNSGNALHVSFAIIRSAKNKKGEPVRAIPLHSVPVGPADLPQCLTNDSLVETHQLFSIPLGELNQLRPLDRLAGTKLAEVLKGARQLFT